MASIRKRGTAYQITVSNGRKPDGTQIVKTTTFTPDPTKTEKQNKKALELFVMDFEQKVRNGKYLDGEKITLREFSDLWLDEYAKDRLAPSTYQMYADLLARHILPEIGNIKLAKIQPVTLNRLYKKLLQKPKENDKRTLSPAIVKRVHATLSSLYSAAVKWNICLENPCDRTEPPKQSRNNDDIKYFTEEETERFLALLDRPMICHCAAHDRVYDTGKEYHVNDYVSLKPIQPQYKLFFHMALFLGCRKGELIALQWQDIDFERGIVHITKSTSYINKQIITKEPKNKSSVRVISIPGVVLTMLEDYRRQQMTKAFSLAAPGRANAYHRNMTRIIFLHSGTVYKCIHLHPTKCLKRLLSDITTLCRLELIHFRRLHWMGCGTPQQRC